VVPLNDPNFGILGGVAEIGVILNLDTICPKYGHFLAHHDACP
jgi:hypothetical protein